MPSNDNHAPPPVELPMSAEGQAALLLVESLIHGLIERSVLTLEDSVAIVKTAIDVQTDVAVAAEGAGAPMWQAHTLLSRVVESLETDMTQD